MKLRGKISLLTIPIVALPLIVLGWASYVQLRDSSKKDSFVQSFAVLDKLQEQFDIQLKNAEANTKLFSNNQILSTYLLTSEDDRYYLLQPLLLREFKTYQETYPDYYEIRVLLPDGFEDTRLINRDIPNQTEEESESNIFQKITKHQRDVVSFIQINPDNHDVAIYVSRPILLRDKSVESLSTKPTLRGYLSITVSIDRLIENITQEALGDKGYLFVSDNQDEFLIRPEKLYMKGVGSRLSDNYTDKTISRDLHRMAEKEQLQIYFARHQDEAGYLITKSVYDNFLLNAWLPVAEIEKNASQLAVTVSIITVLAILMSTLMIYGLFNYFVIRPIQKLETVTKAIGRGDLKKEVNAESEDELGELAKSFDEMRVNLLRSHEQIKYIAYHDNLTGLPNRLMFKEYLGNAIAHARREDELLAILFLDLDNFKHVNDSLGHQMGDQMLKEVSDRLNHSIRETDVMARMSDDPVDMVARLGGDEFIILIHKVDNPMVPGIISKRILKAMNTPIMLDTHEIYAGVSIGITFYPNDADNVDDLIKNADIAMYHAKEQGKNNYQYYSDSMNNFVFNRMAMESKLRKALKENQLFLEYQPQVDVSDETIYGAEALIRWNDPEQGIISPGIFIPLAEETGLIVDIGAWVLREACQQAKAWQRRDCKPIKVSVNVSAIQFLKQDLPALVKNVLKETKLDPGYLEIEITETTIMEDMGRVIDILHQLRDIGVKISLDDFGTGYSSLNYLREFPIDILKIDRGFVNELNNQKSDVAIVTAIIAMAHALNLEVIAEGVEDEYQYKLLRNLGCDYIQGFYLHRPIPVDEVTQLIS